MENQPLNKDGESQVNQLTTSEGESKVAFGTPQNLTVLMVFSLIFLIMAGGLVYLGYQNNQLQQKLNQRLAEQSQINPSVTPTPTTKPTQPSDSSTYTFETFSINYPKSWQAFDRITNNQFFTNYNLKGFDHMVTLEKDDNYLVIGIDTHTTGAQVGGLFTSQAEFQEYLGSHEEVTIAGGRYFLWKGDHNINILNDLQSHSGIYALASLAEFIPNKANGMNGFDDYIQNKNGKSYMFMKLSKSGNTVTPSTVQTDIKAMLETIEW